MSISTMDGLVAALASTNQDFAFYSPNQTNIAGGFVNLGRAGVTSFGQAAIPTVAGSGGHIPTDVPPGYPTIVAGAGGTTLYLARMDGFSTQTGTLFIYDRIFAASGFSGTVTSAQTITAPPSLPSARAPNSGDGLEIFLESYTATGSTASNVTVQYTNSAGTAGRSTVLETFTNIFPINRLQKLRYQDGDTGVQSIQSVTLSASTLTAGNFGVILAKRKATLAVPAINTAYTLDFASLGLPSVTSDAALMFVNYGANATTGVFFSNFQIISG
jgi:hypothetical protein